VGCKVEGSSLRERAFVEVTIEADQFIFGGFRERHDLAVRIDDARARHQVVTVFVASFGSTYYPTGILVRASLHAEVVVVHSGLGSFAILQ